LAVDLACLAAGRVADGRPSEQAALGTVIDGGARDPGVLLLRPTEAMAATIADAVTHQHQRSWSATARRASCRWATTA